jgi:hypothetical protein
VKIGTIWGAKTATSAANIARAISIMLSTVDTTRQARSSSLRLKRPASTGTMADESAPAATSWKMASGSLNAAK